MAAPPEEDDFVPRPPMPKGKKIVAPMISTSSVKYYLAQLPEISEKAVQEVLSYPFQDTNVGKILSERKVYAGESFWVNVINEVNYRLKRNEEEKEIKRRFSLVPKEWPMYGVFEKLDDEPYKLNKAHLNLIWDMRQQLSTSMKAEVCIYSLLLAEEDLPFAFQSTDHLFASIFNKMVKLGEGGVAEKRVKKYLSSRKVYLVDHDYEELLHSSTKRYAMFSLPKIACYEYNQHSPLPSEPLPTFEDPSLFEGIEEDLYFWVQKCLAEYESLRKKVSDPNYLHSFLFNVLQFYIKDVPTDADREKVASVIPVINAFSGLNGFIEGMKYVHELNGEAPYEVHPIYQKICSAVYLLLETYKKSHFDPPSDNRMNIWQVAAIVHNLHPDVLIKMAEETHLPDEKFGIQAHFDYTEKCKTRKEEVPYVSIYEDEESVRNEDWTVVNAGEPAYVPPEW